MADQPPDPAPAAPQPEQPEQRPKPRKKKRIWFTTLGLLLLLIVLLIVFLPAIASTGPVKSFVVGQINDSLNGTVEINDWSIGWTSGVDIDSVKVLDAQGVTILTISRVRVPINLIDAARGNYALGDVLIERPELVKFVIHEDGTSNYQRLLKTGPASTEEEPTGELPEISGKLTIRDLRGTIFRGDEPAPVMEIQPSNIVIDIPDINGPIRNDVRLALGPQGEKPGTLALAGTVDAIENNRVAVETLSADQTLELAQLNIKALGPLLKLAGLDARLGGSGNGKLAVKVAAGSDVSANGELRFDDFAFGGPVLNGDRFESSVLRIPVQVTSASQDGVTRVRAKDTGVHFDQGSVTVTADAPLNALQNVAAQKAPGAEGTAKVDVQIARFAELANQFPNMLKRAEGVQFTDGSVSGVLDVTMTQQAAKVISTINLENVRGTKDGRPLRPLEPMHVTAGATSFGGQNLHDLALKLTSGFATAQGGGETLANLKLTSNVDLRKLREQVGQFTDALDPLESGNATLTLATSGDVTQENALIGTSLNVEVRDLNVVQPATQPSETTTAMLREPWLRLAMTGDIQRGTENFIEGVKDLVLTLQTNNPQKPTVDMGMRAQLAMKPQGVTSSSFTLTKLDVDLPAAQDEFRAFLDVLHENGLEATAGQLSLANPVAGSYDGTALTIDGDAPLALVAANVTLRKTDAATKQQTTPIENRTVRVNAAGAFELGDTFAARLSQFSAIEERKLFHIAKEGGDFVVRLPASGSPQGSGAIVATADLVGINQVLAAFGSPLIERQRDGSMDLQSGQLGARLKLTATEKQTNVNGAIDINNLTITTAAEPIKNETIQTVLKLTSPADGSAMSGSVKLVSSFIKAAVEDLQLQLQQQVSEEVPPVWEMLRRADVTADVESLSKVYTLASAFSSPTTQPTVAAAGEPAEPQPPLNVQSGSARIQMRLAREGHQTNVNISEARIRDLALTKGPGQFKSPRDIVITLAASLDATDAIRQVSVTKLNGDLAVATAVLAEPLVISNLDRDSTTAKGALKVDGKIEEIARLLEAVAGEAPGTTFPYAGQLAMTQRITSAGGPIQLTGKATATDFVVFQQGTQTPVFTEKQLELTDNVTLHMDTKRAAIETFALNMVSSGALKANLTGGISQWETARRLDENMRLELTYDLAKLWPIIRPLIADTPDDFKDLVIAGQAQRTFVLNGSYPAIDANGNELPFHESIKSLTASGGLAVQKFNYEGFDLTDLDLPLYLLSGGQLVTVYADRPREKRHPTPAKLNGGTIDLGGFTIDLGHEQPRLSIPRKQGLLADVSLNPVFAHNVLGKFLNPSFVDPEQARGLIDVTVGEVTNVPLGDLITGKNGGRAFLIMSIREVQIGNEFINNILSRLDVDTRDGAILANIRDAQITIEDGVLAQDLDFMLETFTLAFDGRVRLKDQALLPLVMSIPTARLRALGDDVRKYVPEAITVPITGTTTAPKWNLDVVVQNLVVEAGKKALLGGALDRALGKDPAPTPTTSGTGGATTRRSDPAKPQDPLGGLLEGVLNRARDSDRKREEEKKQEPSGSDRISQPKP
ncbi:MAG TPA: hypothetical protein VGR35_21320 [Tepidisphaeraceae bacterium]|nr:hypothetical protein [Tepidisphaeraceae bacterium]